MTPERPVSENRRQAALKWADGRKETAPEVDDHVQVLTRIVRSQARELAELRAQVNALEGKTRSFLSLTNDLGVKGGVVLYNYQTIRNELFDLLSKSTAKHPAELKAEVFDDAADECGSEADACFENGDVSGRKTAERIESILRLTAKRLREKSARKGER